jgi:hypothetical protein
VAYDPALLVQAWLYGYYRKIRSTRALEAACREDMGFIWLTGNHQPDHNALWRFWAEHHTVVHGLFRSSVKVAVELELVGLVTQAIDGTKIEAACSGRKGFDRRQLEKLLGQLERQISEREKEIAAAGNQAAAALPAELEQASALREKVRTALQRVESGETKHAHPQEPEAERMKCGGGNRFAYNAQAVVDAKEQIIVATEVTTTANDMEQLVAMVSAAQANLPESNPTSLADGGYANAAQLSEAERCGYAVVTPPPNSWRDTSHPYHAAHFRHDPQRQVVTCPQGRELPLQRVRWKDGRLVEVYRSAAVCKDCPVRAQCTQDRHGRTIDIQPGHAAVVVAHERWQRDEVQAMYARRAPTIEPVFAQIKQQMGFRRWTVRGLTKVRAQWALLATTWNLKVLFRHWGAAPGRNSTPPKTNRPRGRGTLLPVGCSHLLSLRLHFAPSPAVNLASAF